MKKFLLIICAFIIATAALAACEVNADVDIWFPQGGSSSSTGGSSGAGGSSSTGGSSSDTGNSSDSDNPNDPNNDKGWTDWIPIP